MSRAPAKFARDPARSAVLSLVRGIRPAIVALALVFGDRAAADSLFLRGGEKLVGKVLAETPAEVTFESQTLGRLQVPREKIEKIERATSPPAPAPVATNQEAAFPFSHFMLTNQFVPWTATAPRGDSFDWIQLKSGEWLKGRMKSLQNDKLEFDSEELDLREFDWEDIPFLRLPRYTAVRFETAGTVGGSVLVTTNEVLVSGASTNAYLRSDLIGITPTGKREINNWSASLDAGLTLRSGNTRQVDFNAQVNIDRRTPSTHLSLEYLGNFGEVQGEQTANNHRITAEFDYFLSRRVYVIVPFAELYRDPLQNLDYRLTLGSGVGYDLIKKPSVEWSVSAGPAYQENYYTSVAQGESQEPGALALVAGTKFHADLTKHVELDLELRAQVTSKTVGETSYHGLAKLKYEIHKHLNLYTSFIWDRITNPQTAANGITPLKDDFCLVTGLGVDL